jgi:hypothetical protein
MTEDTGMSRPERRVSDRRRTYNRRADDREISPPYFEVFERIASALERIEALVRSGSLRLPDAPRVEHADRP